MITKNIITDSSFKNNLNINYVDGRKKYKGLPDSVAEKIKEMVLKKMNICLMILEITIKV